MTFHPTVVGCYPNYRPVETLSKKLEFRLNVVSTDDVAFRSVSSISFNLGESKLSVSHV